MYDCLEKSGKRDGYFTVRPYGWPNAYPVWPKTLSFLATSYQLRPKLSPLVISAYFFRTFAPFPFVRGASAVVCGFSYICISGPLRSSLKDVFYAGCPAHDQPQPLTPFGQRINISTALIHLKALTSHSCHSLSHFLSYFFKHNLNSPLSVKIKLLHFVRTSWSSWCYQLVLRNSVLHQAVCCVKLVF